MENYYLLVVLSVFGGLSFSIMAYCYEKGRLWHVQPPMIAFSVGITGMAVYGIKYLLNYTGFSLPAAIFGLIAGAVQGGAILLIKAARRRGPFSPISASLNLAFIPPVIYSLFILKEETNFLQVTGLVLSLACVVAGSMAGERQDGNSTVQQQGRLRTRVEYFLILILMVFAVGISGLAIKYMTTRKTGTTDMFFIYKDLYFLFLYLGFFLPTVTTFLGIREKPQVHKVAILGITSGIASCIGMFLLGFAARLPAGIGFATVCVFAIAGGGIVCAVFFGERRSLAWYMNLILAAAAVICFNIKL